MGCFCFEMSFFRLEMKKTESYKRDEYIFIFDCARILQLRENEICWLEQVKLKKQTAIYTIFGEFIVRLGFSQVVSLLDPVIFVRASRFAVVNRHMIVEVNKKERSLLLRNGARCAYTAIFEFPDKDV